MFAFMLGIVVSGFATKKTNIYQGYLFAYFEGTGPKEKQEQLRFAYSSDARNWYALNNNRPVLRSKDISQTGGIRDPHILRRTDGNGFYVVATDMFVMKDGWEHNPGIVMLKSDNLTDWNHSVIDLASLYPEKFGNVKWYGHLRPFTTRQRENTWSISPSASMAMGIWIFTVHTPTRILQVLRRSPR